MLYLILVNGDTILVNNPVFTLEKSAEHTVTIKLALKHVTYPMSLFETYRLSNSKELIRRINAISSNLKIELLGKHLKLSRHAGK